MGQIGQTDLIDWINRQIDPQIDRLDRSDRLDGQIRLEQAVQNRQIGRYIDRQVDRQTDTDRQIHTDRQIDRQIRLGQIRLDQIRLE